MRPSRKIIPWTRPHLATVVAMCMASGLMLTACESGLYDDEVNLRGSSLRIARRAAAEGNASMVAMFADKAHAEDPRQIEPLLLLGDSLLAQREASAAVEAYGRALAMAPKDVNAQDGYGRTLIALGRPHMAQSVFEGLLAARPNDVRGLNGLGVALDTQGQHTKARELYRRALAIAPAQASTANNLAMSLMLDGEPEEAVALLEPIAASPSAPPRYRQNLAMAHGLAGQEEKAREWASSDLDDDSVRQNMALIRAVRDGQVSPLSALALDKGQNIETKAPVRTASASEVPVPQAAASLPAAEDAVPVPKGAESQPSPAVRSTEMPSTTDKPVSLAPKADAAEGLFLSVEPRTAAVPPDVTLAGATVTADVMALPALPGAASVFETESAQPQRDALSADELNRRTYEAIQAYQPSVVAQAPEAAEFHTTAEADVVAEDVAARIAAKVIAEAQTAGSPDISFSAVESTRPDQDAPGAEGAPYAAPLAAQEDIFRTASSVNAVPSTPASHGFRIQLAALKSRNALEKERERLQIKHRSDWSGLSLEVVDPVAGDAPDRRYYRLQLNGLPDRKQAYELCNRLNGQGTDCFVVSRKGEI